VDFFRRSIPALLNLLLTAGLQLSGYTNFYVALVLWALMVPLILFALWPWLRRNAELSKLRQDLEKSEGKREELRQQYKELQATNTELREQIKTLESCTPPQDSAPVQGRIGMRTRGGSDEGKNWKIRNQDVGIDSEGTQRNVEDLEID